MILKRLLLRNFRNFKDDEFSFTPGINVIYGDNAQGKTNLLEAIYMVSTGRSPKTRILKELIKDGESYFYIEAHIIKDLVAQSIKIFFGKERKNILYNSKKLTTFSNLLGILPSVMHAPSDIELINNAPSIRRRFLNLHLVQHDQSYLHHLTRFFKALKNRNIMLRSSMVQGIEIWEHEMARSAAYITYARERVINSLTYPVNLTIKKLSKEEDVKLCYTPGLQYKKDERVIPYLKQLEKNRKKDFFLKATQFGPHRDDFLIYIGGKAAKSFASEGQKRSIVTAIRLAEYKLLCSQINGPALMNIDDLEAHLDKKRILALKDIIKGLNQVFITTPKEIDLWEGANILNIQPKALRAD